MLSAGSDNPMIASRSNISVASRHAAISVRASSRVSETPSCRCNH
jgi:hypothetical protein